jgi:signal-transduction protein with cAMP-binding, CBS, and nucleotidyltransferase domain
MTVRPAGDGEPLSRGAPPLIGLRLVPDVIARPQAVTVDENATLIEAAQQMAAAGRGACAVVDADGSLIGMVHQRQVIERIAAGGEPGQCRAVEIMTEAPDWVSPQDSPLDAMALMRLRGVEELPLVDEGRVIGQISLGELHAVAVRELETLYWRLERMVFGESETR